MLPTHLKEDAEQPNSVYNTNKYHISSVHMDGATHHNGNVLPFNVARAQIHPHFKPVLADLRSSYPCDGSSQAITGPPEINMGSKQRPLHDACTTVSPAPLQRRNFILRKHLHFDGPVSTFVGDYSDRIDTHIHNRV